MTRGTPTLTELARLGFAGLGDAAERLEIDDLVSSRHEGAER